MNTFNIKRILFYTFTTLLLIGQISISYKVFSILHIMNDGFWTSWFIPILLSLVVFVFVFFLSLTIANGKDHYGPGEWFITLFRLKSFKKVYHSELGYFVILITEYGVYLFQQDWWRLTQICQFTLDPELLPLQIKNCLDSKYNEKLNAKREEDKNISKINQVKEWDGFLDKVGKRDEKINQLLK